MRDYYDSPFSDLSVKTCKESLADYVGFVDKKRLNFSKSRIRFAVAAKKTFLPSLNFPKEGLYLKVGTGNNLTRSPPSERGNRLEIIKSNQSFYTVSELLLNVS